MIFLGLGSNLHSNFGDRFKNLNLAISLLDSYGIKILRKSSFYETPSYPDESKPKYINIVVLIETKLPLIDLMSVLIFIEEKLERKRNKKNDPRTCDIDILDYFKKVMNFEYNNMNFVIPHQKMNLRNFVLFPLKEICPDWIHPVSNKKIDVLIDELKDQEKMDILKLKNN